MNGEINNVASMREHEEFNNKVSQITKESMKMPTKGNVWGTTWESTLESSKTRGNLWGKCWGKPRASRAKP